MTGGRGSRVVFGMRTGGLLPGKSPGLIGPVVTGGIGGCVGLLPVLGRLGTRVGLPVTTGGVLLPPGRLPVLIGPVTGGLDGVVAVVEGRGGCLVGLLAVGGGLDCGIDVVVVPERIGGCLVGLLAIGGGLDCGIDVDVAVPERIGGCLLGLLAI